MTNQQRGIKRSHDVGMSIKSNQDVEYKSMITSFLATANDHVIVGKPAAPVSSPAAGQHSALPAGMMMTPTNLKNLKYYFRFFRFQLIIITRRY